ncbi:MAG: macro domain-containing protein [Clostridia bacterium]|nr:macro domain-containing protein [Clostridia bacterium]
MPLQIIRQDITKMKVDAIVNPSNRHLYPGGGADLSIHEAAGPELLKACEALGGCEVGKAKITSAFSLPCKYVIHTAGPNWYRLENPEEVLASCYKECLSLALENKCDSVAFPLIASGAYGFPKESVLKIATRVISDFLFENEMLVYIVVFDKTAFAISEKIFCDVKSYIDDNYVKKYTERETVNYEYFSQPLCTSERRSKVNAERKAKVPIFEDVCECAAAPSQSLDDMIKNMDKGFAETLFYYIDKKGMSDVECYKRSNVDKKTFSKIKCNKDYKPSKKTAVSFAIGLCLSLEETNHLLSTVGFCLSNSDIFDVIIQYFVSTGNYESIFDVNEVLYQFDQVTLGV